MILPSPSGPFWWRQTFEIADIFPSYLKIATRSPLTETTVAQSETTTAAIGTVRGALTVITLHVVPARREAKVIAKKLGLGADDL